MASHIYTMLSEKISQDFFGNFSYLTCFDTINSISLPTQVKNISLSSYWFNASNKVEKIRLKVELVKPDKSSTFLGGETIEADINPLSSHRANLILDGMPVDQFGIYWLKIHEIGAKKTTIVSELPLIVRKADLPDGYTKGQSK